MSVFRRRVRRVWNTIAPGVPLLLRISPGMWWIAGRDAVSDGLFAGSFEPDERQVFANLIQPGMTVVDVGAHAGLYTMIASKRTGAGGRVIGFEPSPRERERLTRHLRLNRCSNVVVESCALGDRPGEGDLFVVDGGETGCNSLRPGAVGPGHKVRVPIRVLDDYVKEALLERVDLIKMDVEGAELSVLRGATTILNTKRPVVMCEIEDARIQPWGYAGREIIDLLTSCRYDCYAIAGGGMLAPIDPRSFNGNYLARPR